MKPSRSKELVELIFNQDCSLELLAEKGIVPNNNGYFWFFKKDGRHIGLVPFWVNQLIDSERIQAIKSAQRDMRIALGISDPMDPNS
jgi:hypothetical protein